MPRHLYLPSRQRYLYLPATTPHPSVRTQTMCILTAYPSPSGSPIHSWFFLPFVVVAAVLQACRCAGWFLNPSLLPEHNLFVWDTAHPTFLFLLSLVAGLWDGTWQACVGRLAPLTLHT